MKDKRHLKFLGIIPARYASTRFPGKPLADMRGKPMIQRVYEQVAHLLDDLIVATDDERIVSAVEAFGGAAVLTSPDHRSGTDRCFEAYGKSGRFYDVVLNIQGDEPFIKPSQIRLLQDCFKENETQIATLIKPYTGSDDFESLFDPNTPKVIVNSRQQAIYFSRSVVPYCRGLHHTEWLKNHTYYKHIGLYGYRSEVLKAITALPPTPLETAESLEQLRWIENGYVLKTAVTTEDTIGIDTPGDLEKALLRYPI